MSLRLLFPAVCAACGERGREPFCLLCAGALMPAPPLHVEGADSAQAAYAYGGPLAMAVQALKYRARLDLGRVLGALLGAMPLPAHEVVVPVPLGPRRLAERGYNQALELARAFRAVDPHALRRVREGQPQATLDRAARHPNVSGAFAADPRRVAGRAILLVDDVITTGATAAAATRALRDAGALEVHALALAAADEVVG